MTASFNAFRSRFAAFVLLWLLSACSFGVPQAEVPVGPSATPLPPTATPLPRGGELSIRMAQAVPELRPWQPRSRDEELLTSMLYSGLMRLDADLRPQPDLAERWEATPDGRTITFTLRSGLSWHDGAPLDANDVVYTIEELRSLPFTSTALLNDLRLIAGITAPTTDTVVLAMSERYAPLFAQLALPILPRHLLEGRDLNTLNFWEVPVGSGPFRFAERSGDSIRLTRFEAFHRGPPLLDALRLVPYDIEQTRGALADGSLHLAEVPWNAQRSILDLAGSVQIGDYPENGSYFLAFNLRAGRPFADLAARQALARAIDLARLVETATKGQGIALGSSALPGSWADLTPPPAGSDLEAARAVLDQAGWVLPQGATIRQRDGVALAGELFVRADDERRVLAARRIAEIAASIGAQITVQAADFETVIKERYVSPYAFDMLLGSWVQGAGDPNFADVVFYDPDDFALFHSSQVIQGPNDTRTTRNFVGFSDPEYDAQAQAGRQLYIIEERIAAYQQTQARIASQVPYVFLWADRIPLALSQRVSTLDGPVELTSPLYFWNIERWYLNS